PTAGLEAALSALPAAGGKVHRLGPAVDTALFAPAAPPPGGDRPLRVVYAGTVGLAQGLDTLVEAARIAGPEAVEVRVAGDGAEAPALRARLGRERAPNVRLLGMVPYERVPELYGWADTAAVLLRDRPIFRGALPTKMLEAMARARPLVLSARGEAAQLVETHGAGVVVAPEDPRALAEALLELARDRARLAGMGAAARRCAERYDWAATADRWHALLGAVQ
ncbi:MAG: glycosyltransferase, partial [Thermoleophilaceae bacterium]